MSESAITRQLRRLRQLGIMKRVVKTYRYYLIFYYNLLLDAEAKGFLENVNQPGDVFRDWQVFLCRTWSMQRHRYQWIEGKAIERHVLWLQSRLFNEMFITSKIILEIQKKDIAILFA